MHMFDCFQPDISSTVRLLEEIFPAVSCCMLCFYLRSVSEQYHTIHSRAGPFHFLFMIMIGRFMDGVALELTVGGDALDVFFFNFAFSFLTSK